MMELKLIRNVRLAFILLALAVAFGAFGAHFLSDRLEERSLKAWQNAVLYQVIHSFGVILCFVIARQRPTSMLYILRVQRIMLLGVLFFSGSLYLLSTSSISGLYVKWLGPITPIGGVLFIAGWLMAALALSKKE